MKRHIQHIRKKILPTLKQYDVTRAAIFGSFARGQSSKRSDIDLLIEFKGEKSLLDLAGCHKRCSQVKKQDIKTEKGLRE